MIALILFCCTLASPLNDARLAGQSDDSARIAKVRQLYDAKRWDEAARAAEGPSGQPAELDFLAGMSFAHLERWSDARDAFAAAHRKSPRDARFLVERAGAEYRLKDFRRAKNDLREAMRLGSRDPYTREFLGTLYLLEDNLEAALKYWNPIEQPQLTSLKITPEPQLNKKLLIRAVTLAPAGVLQRDTLLEADARLANLNVFPAWRTHLQPDGPKDYAATLHLTETSNWGSSWAGSALSLLRGLPYDTIYPSYVNIAGQAANLDSIVRWDPEKRRISADFSTPVFHDPAKRITLFFDARNENWNLSQTFTGSTAPLSDLNMRRASGGAQFHSVPNGWWDWTIGLEGVSRSFRNVDSQLAPPAVPFFTASGSLDTWVGVHRSLLRFPERRFTLDGTAEGRIGRGFASDLGLFERLGGSLAARWLPQARGDDYEVSLSLKSATTFGDVPLDELFQLGVERDNDLWLRGHPGTTGGRKGAAPLGRRYVLFNAEINKIAYNSGLFRVQLGPFLDSGKITDPSGLFGSREWLWDAGPQLKIRVLGSVSVILSYGWDLRSGKSAFYGTTSR